MPSTLKFPQERELLRRKHRARYQHLARSEAAISSSLDGLAIFFRPLGGKMFIDCEESLSIEMSAAIMPTAMGDPRNRGVGACALYLEIPDTMLSTITHQYFSEAADSQTQPWSSDLRFYEQNPFRSAYELSGNGSLLFRNPHPHLRPQRRGVGRYALPPLQRRSCNVLGSGRVRRQGSQLRQFPKFPKNLDGNLPPDFEHFVLCNTLWPSTPAIVDVRSVLLIFSSVQWCQDVWPTMSRLKEMTGDCESR